MRETGTLCNLTLPQLPVRSPSFHFPGAAAQPQLRGVISTVFQHSHIKSLSASTTPSAALALSTRRDSRFEILVSRNKILEN